MRMFVVLLWVGVALAGCTQGDSAGQNTLSCEDTGTHWVQSPGQPGFGVVSYLNETSSHNLKGVTVMKPTLLDKEQIDQGKVVPLYDWDGAILDVAELRIIGADKTGNQSAAIDGYYSFKAWRSIKYTPHESDGKSVTWDPEDKRERLGFRVGSRSAPVQLEIQLRPGQDNIIANKTFFIEFAEPNEPTNPGDLWLEWEFVADLDNDRSTASAGILKTNVSWWYRRC